MPSNRQHNPPDPTLTHLRTLRGRLASDRPYDQQDALREVIAHAAQTKLISFSTAARLEDIGWSTQGSDVAAAVRLAVANLILCWAWEAIWPPSAEMGGWIEDDGTVVRSPTPDAPVKSD